MERRDIINNINPEILISEFNNFSFDELGRKKITQIIENLNTSKKVYRFIIEAKGIEVPPGSLDILNVIHSSTYFTFAKAETIAIASILLLVKWYNVIGIKRGFSDKTHLNTVFFEIIDICQGFKINKEYTFFDKFLNYLNRILKLREEKFSSISKLVTLSDDELEDIERLD